MRGYGEVPADVTPELNGIVHEIKALLDQLNAYLSQAAGEDPGERLQRLQQTGDEIELLRKLERVIALHGLVDFRGRLSAILDRIESKNFEIALFGRVSWANPRFSIASLALTFCPSASTRSRRCRPGSFLAQRRGCSCGRLVRT